MSKEHYRNLVVVVLGLILLAPLALYAYTFGFKLSSKHTVWAEFGSAMAGIYSPLIAILALAVLIGQVRIQARTAYSQYEQSYVQEARLDIEYFIGQLDRLLTAEVRDGVNARRALLTAFDSANVEALRHGDYLSAARLLNDRIPGLFSLWSAIYSILVGLRTNKRYPYAHNYSNAKLKVSGVVSIETCHALDAFHFALTENTFRHSYEFNDHLNPRP